MSKSYELYSNTEGCPRIDMVIKVDGNTSDGYHTFDELYEHRMALSMCFFNMYEKENPGTCYKAKKHNDGTMFDGMFVVGCQTPFGQISYHYNLNDGNWERFHIPEKEFAPYFDGHTPNDVIDRLTNLAEGL